jgi:hypothetical protein
MPLAPQRVEVRQKVLVNAGFLALLTLTIVTVTTIYITGEQNFHWWIDWYYPALEIANTLRDSPAEGIALLVKSLGQERNRLYTLPIVPFFWAFGDSRLTYQLGLALVYLLPFPLVMGAIAAQISQTQQRLVFWLTACITLLIPVTWVSTFMGIPDTGGAVFLGLATLVYLQDVRLKQWRRVPAIGVLIGLAILLRRPFIYGGFALLAAVGIQALMFFAVEVRKRPAVAVRGLLMVGVRLVLMGATTLATLMTVAPGFTYGALTIDYRTLYTSWSLPFSDSFGLYGAYYGLGTWLIVAIGFSAAILTRAVVLPAIIFTAISGGISLIIWTVVLRYGNVFYSLQTTPFVIIGIIAFFWTTWTRQTGKRRQIMLGVAGCYLVINFVIGLTPIGKISSVLQPLFALSAPPLVRSDYDQVLQLVDYLRKIAPKEEAIFVVGAQRLHLDSSLVKVAELMQYGRDNPKEHSQTHRRILNILQVPKVNSRDEYPLQPLLQAQYVVVPSRLPDYPGVPVNAAVVGEWLPNQEHQVVRVVFDAFSKNWEIAKDFKLLPTQFSWEDHTTVRIYQRIRPTSLATTVRTLGAMQRQIGQRPGSQLDWIGLSPLPNTSTVAQNTDSTHQVIVYANAREERKAIDMALPLAPWDKLQDSSDRSSNLSKSFLYFGTIPEQAEVSGAVILLDKPCLSVSLGLTMLNQEGQIISSTANQDFPLASNFRLKFSGKKAPYLLLNIRSQDENNVVNSCTSEINSLSISSQN